MYALYLCVVVLLPIFDRGGAIRCYLCSSKDSEDCLIPRRDHLKLENCSSAALDKTAALAGAIDYAYKEPFRVDVADIARNIDFNCLKVVTKVGFKHYALRGCQLAEQNNFDICRKLEAVNTNQLHLQHCSRCGSDDCNSATRTFSFRHVAALALVTTLTATVTHTTLT